MRVAAHLLAGEDKDILLGSAAKQQTFRERRLGEKERTIIADQDGRLQNVDFSKPGIYSIADQAGQEVQRLAVNVPVEESDLTALTVMDFQRQLTRSPAENHSTLAAGLFGAGDHRKDLARLLLMAALVLLFVESLLANRTYA